MQVFLTLTRRELATFFVSITGYVILAVSALFVGFGFVVLVTNLGSDPMPTPVTELFFQSSYFWYLPLLATPVITMRLFALEKYSGTFETLMTTPVGDMQVVAAKFTAAFIFYVVLMLPMAGCIWLLRPYAQSGALDVGTIVCTFLGVFLFGALYLSMGCLASALTRNQTTAAMVAFGFGVSLFSLAYLAAGLQPSDYWKLNPVGYFALFYQMKEFARGVIDSRSVAFSLSLTFFFLFLTLRVIESRRWK